MKTRFGKAHIFFRTTASTPSLQQTLYYYHFLVYILSSTVSYRSKIEVREATAASFGSMSFPPPLTPFHVPLGWHRWLLSPCGGCDGSNFGLWAVAGYTSRSKNHALVTQLLLHANAASNTSYLANSHAASYHFSLFLSC